VLHLLYILPVTEVTGNGGENIMLIARFPQHHSLTKSDIHADFKKYMHCTTITVLPSCITHGMATP